MLIGSTPGLWHEPGTLRRQVSFLDWLGGEGEGSDLVRMRGVRLLDRPLVREVAELRELREAHPGTARCRRRGTGPPAPPPRAGREPGRGPDPDRCARA